MRSGIRIASMAAAAFLRLLLLSGCNPKTPIVYKRLIIGTYRPDPTAWLISTRTQVALFDKDGSLLAESSNGNPTYPDFARLDYSGGISSGVYYIRIIVEPPTSFAGPYAIRVVTDIDPADEYPAAEDWYFSSLNPADTPYEDDDPLSGGIPVKKNRMAIGEKHIRELESEADYDWFELVLP